MKITDAEYTYRIVWSKNVETLENVINELIAANDDFMFLEFWAEGDTYYREILLVNYPWEEEND